MRNFRVYNRVRKVGVTWPVAGVDIGVAPMVVLMSVAAIFVALTVLGSWIGGPPLAMATILIGVVAFLTTFIAIARVLRMGRLGEITQIRLISDSLRKRRYRNFDTPDVAGDVNDTSRSVAGSDSVYRNF